MNKIKTSALLLDVYGTIITSTASSNDGPKQDSFKKMKPYMAKTVKKFGLGQPLKKASRKKPERALFDMMEEEIVKSHAKSKARGIKWPEVRIEKIWARTLKRLGLRGSMALLEKKGASIVNYYNSLHKQMKLYPGCKNALLKIKKRGVWIGIVSNSQFYTVPQLKELFGASDYRKIFSEELFVRSYEEGFSKPNPKIFSKAVAKLKRKGLTPDETVYMGNDMLSDVFGAKKNVPEMKAILFASDCVKWRKKELKGKRVKPDAILRKWSELPKVLA